MRLRHCYVTLIDLPEALPFAIEPSITGDKAEKGLFNFIQALEKAFKESFCYIGEDVISEKYYRRFLFERDGFVEIMTGAPAVLCAHFTKQERANKFASALKAVLKKLIKGKKLEILLNCVEIHGEKEQAITYEKWSKMHEIRTGI